MRQIRGCAVWALGAAEQWTLHRDSSTVGALPERTGVRPGDELVAIDGVGIPVNESRRPRILMRADPLADEWALASAVAPTAPQYPL